MIVNSNDKILKGFYKDNYENRKHGRVGQKYGDNKKITKKNIFGADDFFHSAEIKEDGYKLPWTGKVGDVVEINGRKGRIVGVVVNDVDGDKFERPLIKIGNQLITNKKYKNLSIDDENDSMSVAVS